MEMRIAPRGAELSRSINLPLLTLYGLGTTIGAGIYVVIGETAAVAGYYLPAVFLIAALVAGLSAASFAELSTRYPVSAGEAAYLRAGLGFTGLSLLTGLAVASSGAISSATLLQGGAGYLAEIIPLPERALFIILLLVLGALVAWGILKSLLLTAFITLLEIGGLMLIILYAPADPVTLVTRAVAAAGPLDFIAVAGMSSAILLAFFAFIGFEDMVNIVEEVEKPRRTMPAAIGLTLIITALLYVWIALIAVNAVDPSELGGSNAPLALIFTSLSGYGVWIFSLIGTLAVVNGVIIQLVMGSRVIYGLARLGQLPALLGYVSETTRTPLYATALMCAVILVLGMVLSLRNLAQTTSALTLAAFALVNLSLVIIKLRPEQPKDIFRVPAVVPVLGFATSVSLLVFETARQLGAFPD